MKYSLRDGSGARARLSRRYRYWTQNLKNILSKVRATQHEILLSLVLVVLEFVDGVVLQSDCVVLQIHLSGPSRFRCILSLVVVLMGDKRGRGSTWLFVKKLLCIEY